MYVKRARRSFEKGEIEQNMTATEKTIILLMVPKSKHTGHTWGWWVAYRDH